MAMKGYSTLSRIAASTQIEINVMLMIPLLWERLLKICFYNIDELFFKLNYKYSTLSMTLKCIWWWGYSSGDLGSVEY